MNKISGDFKKIIGSLDTRMLVRLLCIAVVVWIVLSAARLVVEVVRLDDAKPSVPRRPPT